MSIDYSYRKQATLCPGRASTKAGCSVLQRSVQCGHLDASGQPFMSPMGLGISPVSAMVCFSSNGLVGGIADRSACV